MTYLTDIETRQRKSVVRDLLFAGLIALAAILSIVTLMTAIMSSAQR